MFSYHSMPGILRLRWTGFVGLALAVVVAGVAGERKDTSVFDRAVPQTIAHLKTIEQAVCEIAERVVPCTVSVRVGPAVEGSGVVVSEDGYVLTAAHVSGRPGRDVEIRFPDGKTVPGKTLGIHTDADGGLIKISAPGKWPFVPIVGYEDLPKPGDWCVAVGHPGGFQEERSPPVRLGRIIDVDAYTLRTDCTITGGDSGGPLLDIRGRVIGIHSRIAQQATVNLHGPALAYVEAWEQLKAGEIYPAVPKSRFLARLDIDGDGQITRGEIPEGPYRRIYDRLVAKYDLDAGKAYTIDQLRDVLGWRDVPRQINIRPYDPDQRGGDSLGRERFVRGREVLAAFRSVVAQAAAGTVEVICDGERVALGAVVDGGGLVVTKASQLQGEVVCRTSANKELAAQLLETDPHNDLALLRVEARDLPAITWAPSDHLRPGAWLATPNPRGEAVSVGVVSVPQREIEGTPGVLGVEIRNSETPGATVARVFPDSGAAQAGIRVHDVITKIMDQTVSDLAGLQKAVRAHRAGEVIRATVLRDDKELLLDVKLGMPEDVFRDLFPQEFRGRNRLNGPLNERRDDFPTAFQHDSVLHPTYCGGPVVDVLGRVVGINVARADRVVSYAVPIAAVTALIEKTKAKTVAGGE